MKPGKVFYQVLPLISVEYITPLNKPREENWCLEVTWN